MLFISKGAGDIGAVLQSEVQHEARGTYFPDTLHIQMPHSIFLCFSGKAYEMLTFSFMILYNIYL